MKAAAVSTIHTRLGGWLGAAIDASRSGRLSHFITGPDSAAIRLFEPAVADLHRDGDWYGEHAGKWLQAAARAAANSGDAGLRQRVQQVALHLPALQRPDGYLGTYAADRRFTEAQPPKPVSWDGAPAWRTWDVWVHAYLLLGLLEVQRHFPQPAVLQAAVRIGELCWTTFVERGFDITTCGNHHGLSATVLIDPATRLHALTGDARFLALAQRLVEQADAHPPLALLRKLLAGSDAAEVGTGKAYQLLWTGVGLARLHRSTGRADLLQAALALWHNVRDHHLTLGGGPWGGVGQRSREVFNPAAVFSPQAYVETCSTLAWIQLSRELLLITGDALFAEEIEKSAYNDLLGAAAANGEDWCYYVFPNGQRIHTTRWRCCKSSGALALEELPELALQWLVDAATNPESAGELRVQLYGPADSRVPLPGGGELRLRQHTRYPADGAVRLQLELARPLPFTLALRIPSWAAGASLLIDGQTVGDVPGPGTWCRITRVWTGAELIELQLPMPLQQHQRTHRNVQESRAPGNLPVRQEVQRDAYVAFTRGPLVYATGLIDGYKTQETLRLPEPASVPLAGWLQVVPDAAAIDGAPALRLQPLGRAAIDLQPYYRAGGRDHGAWRLSWFSLAPDGSPPWTEEPLS